MVELASCSCPFGRRAPEPARGCGSTLVLSLFQAVVVPSGFRTRVQPQRWMTTWWWNQHSSTQSLTEVGPPLALCRVWCTWQASAGWSHRPAHWQCRSRSITALRIPAGMVSAYPMSSGRLGPASRAPSCRRRRKQASPPGPDRRSTALPMTACSSAAQAASRRASPPRVQLDAQPDQVLQRVHVDVPGDDRGHRRVARDALRGVPVQPGPAVTAGLGRGGAVRGPRPRGPARSTAPAARSSPSSRSRSAREMCAQTLTGCPARSGSRLAATRRRIASASASWYRCSRVRSSSAPAGADSASSTCATIAAHSGVRSPVRTPAPWNVVSSRTPRSPNAPAGSSSGRSPRARSYISANSAARSASPSPAAAALTSSSSDSFRNFSGSLSVHWQMVRP